jgi:site-specific DNA-methyltransferase (cytosine-N4-specific)
MEHCKAKGLDLHPARMQQSLAEFFVQFLTDTDDIVLDPFAGSNTTGYVAETLNRRWVSIEAKAEYAHASAARFHP